MLLVTACTLNVALAGVEASLSDDSSDSDRPIGIDELNAYGYGVGYGVVVGPRPSLPPPRPGSFLEFKCVRVEYLGTVSEAASAGNKYAQYFLNEARWKVNGVQYGVGGVNPGNLPFFKFYMQIIDLPSDGS